MSIYTEQEQRHIKQVEKETNTLLNDLFVLFKQTIEN